MIFQLLAGIVVAAGVFAALMWSVYQTVTQRGKLQLTHVLAILGTLGGMASLSFVSPTFAWIFGLELCIAALTAVFLERRWNRLLPVFQLIFGITLILGLPFNT